MSIQRLMHTTLLFAVVVFFNSCNSLNFSSSVDENTKIVTSSGVWVDHFDKPTGYALTGGGWYTYTDKANGGASILYPMHIKDAYIQIPERNNNNALKFTYKLNKANYKWDPFVGFSVALPDSTIPVSCNSLKAIAYEFKGSKHGCVFVTSDIKDYSYYQKTVPESDQWVTVIIPIKELKQPSWGRPVEFDATLIQALTWNIMGSTGDSGDVYIDNIRFLRKLPEVEVNPTNIDTLSTTIDLIDTSYTRNIPSKVKIADWYGFRKAAYSLTFDDNLSSQLKYVTPILDAYGLKATFYVLTNDNSWIPFTELTNNGHEVGSHSVSHSMLSNLSDGSSLVEGTLQYELGSSQKSIQKKLPQTKIISFAYPFGDHNEHIVNEVQKYYTSSRGVWPGYNDKHPAHWMNLRINSVTYPTSRSLDSDKLLMNTVENYISNNIIPNEGWGIYLAHDVLPFTEAIATKNSWQPVSTESFEPFAKWLAEKQKNNELWIETVGNVTRYIKERDAVSIEIIEDNSNKMILKVTDNLPNEIYQFPITLEINISSPWKKVTVKQNNKSATLVVNNSKLIIEAIPDAGLIEIIEVE